MKVQKMCVLPVFFVVASVALFAHADVVCYEYMTIAGSTTTDGVRVLTDYVPKSNTVVRAMYSSSSAATSGAGELHIFRREARGHTGDVAERDGDLSQDISRQ